jgi:hypothetical protein
LLIRRFKVIDIEFWALSSKLTQFFVSGHEDNSGNDFGPILSRSDIILFIPVRNGQDWMCKK